MPVSDSSFTNIPVSLIDPGDNDRQHFANLEELSASIKDQGLANPITVRPLSGGRFEIVAGERRFRACAHILKWEMIPAIVKELTDQEASAIMLCENTGRADLNVIEESTAYQKRRDLGWSVERISQVAGVSLDRVNRRLKLLKLVPEVQHLLKFGNFPVGHADSMCCLDHNRQRIAVRIFSQSSGMSQSSFKHMVNTLHEEQCQQSLFDLESFWTQQVTNDKPLPRRGKKAQTGAPLRNDLPPIQTDPKWDAGRIIDRYISDLLTAGHSAEAGAIGTLYNTLVHQNYLSVPVQSTLTLKEQNQ